MNLEERNILTGKILDACIEVHRCLGPGLLESTYEICLMKEFELRGINAKRQVKLPIFYKDFELDQDYRIDVLVEDEFIIELKCVDTILPIHTAQTITYLKLAGKSVGFLVNFNVAKLKEGFKRIINSKNYNQDQLPSDGVSEHIQNYSDISGFSAVN